MRSLVIVRAEAPDRYMAQVVGIPEIRAVAATEAEAVAEVRQSLVRWLASGKLVWVEVPTQNPWPQGAGMFKDDPLFHLWQEAIAENRRQADADPNVFGPSSQSSAAPLPQGNNPWLDTFGRSAHDPDFPELLREIEQARLQAAAD